MKTSNTKKLRERLAQVLARNMESLIEATVVAVRSKIVEYKERPADELAASVRLCYHAYLEFLTTESFASLTDYITQMAQRRSDEQVRYSAIQGVFLTFREVVMPVLRDEFKGDYEQIIAAFLGRLLPSSFSISTGFVIDAAGGISRQIDIVIYRNDYHRS